MSKTYEYDVTLLENIEAKFKEGADKIDDILAEYKSFVSTFPQYYDGQANDEIFDSLSSTMDSHIQLLKLCYENMEKYVANTREEIVAADEAIGNSISGNGAGGGGGGKGR